MFTVNFTSEKSDYPHVAKLGHQLLALLVLHSIMSNDEICKIENAIRPCDLVACAYEMHKYHNIDVGLNVLDESVGEPLREERRVSERSVLRRSERDMNTSEKDSFICERQCDVSLPKFPTMILFELSG